MLLVFAGCAKTPEMSTEVRTDGDGNTVTIIGDGHNTSVTSSDGGRGRFVGDDQGGGTYSAIDGEGNTSISSTNLLLDESEVGIALYPGSTKAASSLDSKTLRGGKASGSVERITDDPVEKVTEFLAKQIETRSDSKNSDHKTIMGSKGKRNYVIFVSRRENKTHYSVSYNDR